MSGHFTSHLPPKYSILGSQGHNGDSKSLMSPSQGNGLFGINEQVKPRRSRAEVPNGFSVQDTYMLAQKIFAGALIEEKGCIQNAYR